MTMRTTEVAREEATPRAVDADRDRRLARWVLLLLGGAFALTQLILLPLGRGPGWDESVYLSQVTPGAEALDFWASRARGITLLVAPITALGGSIVHVRLFLIAVSSIGLVAAFWTWIPRLGLAVPIGAAVFALSWITLASGYAVMPNLWPALLGVAITGLLMRHLHDGHRRPLVVATALIALTALFRPTDATVLGVGIGIFVLLFERRAWRCLPWLAAGLTIGWLPWLIEMPLRFGGIHGAVSAAGELHYGRLSFLDNVSYYLVQSGGGNLGDPVSPLPLVWWTATIGLAALAIGSGRSVGERRSASLLVICALGLGSQYVLAVPSLAGRFLLPSHALISLAAAIGVLRLLTGVRVARVLGATLLVLLVPLAIWQAGLARDIERRSAIGADAKRALGLEIREVAGGRPCLLVSRIHYASIALAAGCQGERPVWDSPSPDDLEDLVSRGVDVYLVRRAPLGPVRLALIGSPGAMVVPHPTGDPWYVYAIPAGTTLGDLARPMGEDEALDQPGALSESVRPVGGVERS